MAESKGLAITALGLGVVGLFTAGGLVLGSLLGLVLAVAALTRRSPAGRDVAWAAVAANLVALLTILPVSVAVWAYLQSPWAFASQDDSLPEPVAWPGAPAEVATAAPPPPPPPPIARRSAAPARAAREHAAAGPVRVGGRIPEPRKTRDVRPVYPQLAVAARVQGVVILECTISTEGKVVAVRKLRGVPLLDQAAVDAVKQWEYAPTLLDGVAVPVIMTVTVNFKLS